MFIAFKTYLKAGFRNFSIIFWVLVFPLIMMALFQLMFNDVNDMMHVSAQPMAVAQDANWNKQSGVAKTVEALAGRHSGSAEQGGGNDSEQLISITRASSIEAAKQLVVDGKAKGYLYVGDGGDLHMTLADTTVNSSDQVVTLATTAIDYALQQYNETGRVVGALAAKNHAIMADSRFSSSVGDSTGFLRHLGLTGHVLSPFARYYFSMLGMACLLGMSIAIDLITLTQANLSALGVRVSVSPSSKIRQITAVLMSSWSISFTCMLIAFLVMRYVVGIGIGGREPAAVLAVAASTLMASGMGLLIGVIPKLSARIKLSLGVMLTLFLSFFTGLYGTQAMALGDRLRRQAPVLARINPASQVCDLFYDLLYYDDYRPFLIGLGLILATTAVFILVAVVMLRRQRYDYL